jgi:phospholipase/carboxylesterase
VTDPHGDQPRQRGGAPLASAHAAAVLVHGRGATARSILQLGEALDVEGVAYLAPQAAGNTWYPNPFTAPVASNEPGRSSGLSAVGDAVAEATDAGVPTERVLLLGFSQGACLASEFVARNPMRYGGLAALSGGLIGDRIDPEAYAGGLDGTPVFLGCSDVDPHIPAERVHETARVFERLHADVTVRLYEGMAHTVNGDERERVASMLSALVA